MSLKHSCLKYAALWFQYIQTSCLPLTLYYCQVCHLLISVSVSFIVSAASCANSQEWTLNRSIPELRLVR